MALHGIVVEGLGTIDTALRGEATMRLNDLFLGYARPALEGIDVLGKASMEKALLRKQPDKRMCDGRAEFSRVELVGQSIDFEKRRTFQCIARYGKTQRGN